MSQVFSHANCDMRHYNLAPLTCPTAHMSDNAALLAAVKTTLDAYMDPYLGETLGAAGAVREVLARDSRHVVAQIQLGFPVGGYREELLPALQAHLKASGVDASLDIELHADIRSHAVQR